MSDVEALRADIKRLQTLGAEVQNARGDAEVRAAEAKHDADSLRAAISDLAAELEKDRRTPRSNAYNTGYNDGHHDARVEIGHRLRAVLKAATS